MQADVSLRGCMFPADACTLLISIHMRNLLSFMTQSTRLDTTNTLVSTCVSEIGMV